MPEKTLPQLSLGLRSFYAEDPGTWDDMFNLARAADAAGVDRLMASDHVVFGERLEEYGRPEIGGSKGGKQPTGPDGHWLEPLTALAVVSGMTKRIRLRTHILIAALRRPVVLAKTTSTIDVLSGGRLDLGVGVGWQKEEYDAAGLSFEGRGKLLDHTMDVVTTLWKNQRAEFNSPELSFANIHQMPKPLQPGGVPIWTSGTIRSTTIRRIAKYGPRWIPWGPEAADLVNTGPQMREEVQKAGGSIENFQISGYLPIVRDEAKQINLDATMEKLQPLVAAGVTDFALNANVPTNYDAAVAYLTPIVEAFRAAVGRPKAD